MKEGAKQSGETGKRRGGRASKKILLVNGEWVDYTAV
jgi:hypothetical protein